MNERSFWASRLQPRLRKYGHFERVENAVGNGTPDVDYCLRGVAGKIELKYAAMPKREATPVLSEHTGLRKSQLVWIKKRMRAGGSVWVLIGAGDRTWLIPGDVAHLVNGACAEELNLLAEAHWWGAVDFDELADLLAA